MGGRRRIRETGWVDICRQMERYRIGYLHPCVYAFGGSDVLSEITLGRMKDPAATAILLCGPSLAGKSTVAADLAELLDAVVVSADEINAKRGLPFGGEGLPESVWAETLRIQLEQVHKAGAMGQNVVVDDTLCYRWLRDRFRAVAESSGLEHSLFVLRPPLPELEARHAALSVSRARPVLSLERLRDHLARFEWPAIEEGALDITEPSRYEAVLRFLRRR